MLAGFFRFIVAVTTAVVLAGCATRATSIDAQWVSPSLAGKRDLRSVMVLGALRDTTQRRLLEDRMVDALAAAGVKAVASYKFIPDGGQLSEDQLRKAVAAAGASHVLTSSITGMTTDVRVTPGMVSGPGWGPGRGWPSTMGPGWGGFSRTTIRPGRVRLRPTSERRRTSTATRGCSMLRSPKWSGRRQRRRRSDGTRCRS